MSKPKILFWDLETAGVNALRSDLGFVIVFGYKWSGEKHAHALTIAENDLHRFDDKPLLLEASHMLVEADLTVAHFGCPAPTTKVLLSDFSYKDAGDLNTGDKLLSVNETIRQTNHRRFEVGEVTHAEDVKTTKLRIELSDGTELDVTPNHPFLVPKPGNGANWQWVEARYLALGDILTRAVPVWKQNYGYEAGYLAAAVDGEGHLSMGPGQGAKLGFAQKSNSMLSQFQDFAKLHGYNFKNYSPHTDVQRLSLNGIQPVFKFLGEFRPTRLLDKAHEKLDKLCLSVPQGNRTTVKSVRNIGVSTVINLTTSSSTYITEGFVSHNSVFDRRFFQGRLLINNLAPIPPTKMRDTCMISRSVANFSSNRLKHLAKILDLRHQKLDNNWPQAWFLAMQGNMQAINGLAKYCRGDVLALEELYYRLLPFDQPHPRVVFERDTCKSCGGAVEYRGVAMMGERRYKRYVCKSCGKWGRQNSAVKEAK